MQTVLAKMNLSNHSPDAFDSGNNQPRSASVFFCSHIGALMSRLACEARKQRCDDSDADRIRNPVPECRGCEGHVAMKARKIVTNDSKPRKHTEPAPEVAGYHMGLKTKHQKFPCQCCGANVWLLGAYCTSCHSQFGFAAEHGIGKDQAIQVVQQFYADGGVRPHRGGKGNRAKNLIDWEGELGKMSKYGTCEWCGRHISLVQRIQGKWACMFCMKAIEVFVDNGGKEADFEKLHGLELRQKAHECKARVKTVFSWSPRQSKLNRGLAGEKVGETTESGLHNSQPEPLKESPKSATKKKRSPDLPSIKLPITERERPIIEWIDRKAAAERRNRSGQVWALLEEIMKGEGA